jgi:serine/threonine-protein kinase
MNDARWDELKGAFAQLVELPSGERAVRLATMAVSDAELHRGVKTLLAADARAESILSRFDLAGQSNGGHATGADRPDRTATEASTLKTDPLGYTGRLVTHFRVLDVLGAGGMGVVYRAEDERLGRTVALKFLLPQYSVDPVARERFLQEARAASALDHPSVCTVYETGATEDGQLFLVMACYAGETLKDRLARGALPIAEAVDVTRELLRALGAAHAAAVVHRDLKPGNVMLTSDGAVKILDFGLAKLRDLTITAPDQRPGTAAYMSPEQLDGESVDHRSDLWSLGVVMYEMLTGRRPFGGGHELSTVYAILHEDPVPPSRIRAGVSPTCDAVIAKLLRKTPGGRYATADDVLAALAHGTEEVPVVAQHPVARPRNRRALVFTAVAIAVAGLGITAMTIARRASSSTVDSTAAPAAPVTTTVDQPSVAVLPFIDMSPARDQEYFSDGVTEEILNTLAEISELRVPARSSSFFFRNKNLPIGEIAAQLGVTSVLTGSVRKAGGRIRISAQLIDARADRHLWSHTFDGDDQDVFEMQSTIARTVAEAMKVRIASGWSVNAPPQTASVVAHDLYLRGRAHWNRRTANDLRQAIRFFEAATRIDSSYARAYAGLALAYTVLPLSPGAMSGAEALPRMEAAASRALELDSTLAEAHAARGYSYHWNWRWADADREFHRAIALNPNDVTSRQWYGEHSAKMGRSGDGEAEVRRAIALDPLAIGPRNDLGVVLMLDRRYAEAVEQLDMARRMDSTLALPNFLVHRAQLWAGNAEASAEAGRRASELGWGNKPNDLAILARATRDSSLRASAFDVLDRWQRETLPNWTDIAMFYALLGDRDRAIGALEAALRIRHPRLSQLKASPWADPLRGDPRFEQIMRALAFPE